MNNINPKIEVRMAKRLVRNGSIPRYTESEGKRKSSTPCVETKALYNLCNRGLAFPARMSPSKKEWIPSRLLIMIADTWDEESDPDEKGREDR